jgi:hypothetical protein
LLPKNEGSADGSATAVASASATAVASASGAARLPVIAKHKRRNAWKGNIVLSLMKKYKLKMLKFFKLRFASKNPL